MTTSLYSQYHSFGPSMFVGVPQHTYAITTGEAERHMLNNVLL
jgi:hypothetical protein